ncbi:MAG: hypothetical protein HRU23_12420 [Gammaproteobacteria bacterium]|nr:hypothetical protein [Gammaproteobacteria bacterium]
MKKWYASLKKNQKIFMFLVSIACILIYGAGLVPLAILIYLQLGQD